jgi:hypothetical protein
MDARQGGKKCFLRQNPANLTKNCQILRNIRRELGYEWSREAPDGR